MIQICIKFGAKLFVDPAIHPWTLIVDEDTPILDAGLSIESGYGQSKYLLLLFWWYISPPMPPIV
jgi:hypothetical protein